jgi:hypothetical protein
VWWRIVSFKLDADQQRSVEPGRGIECPHVDHHLLVVPSAVSISSTTLGLVRPRHQSDCASVMLDARLEGKAAAVRTNASSPLMPDPMRYTSLKTLIEQLISFPKLARHETLRMPIDTFVMWNPETASL